MAEAEGYLTVAGFADAMGVSRRTVSRWIAQRLLTVSSPPGARNMIPASEVEAFRARHTVAARPQKRSGAGR